MRKYIPLILLIMFLAGLAALCFAIEIDFRNRDCKCSIETEVIKNGKSYKIVEKY